MPSVLEALVGPQAKGSWANTLSRLKQPWGEEYQAWRARRFDRDQWAYVWADGIYSGLRAERQRLCVLVVIGVSARGEKYFLAIEDGVRESTQSWREVLLELKGRGLNAPQLARRDGVMGFWSALEEIYPQTRVQRCWTHNSGNVLNALPKSAHPKAKRGLHEIWQAESREQAHTAFDRFVETDEAKYPKATN